MRLSFNPLPGLKSRTWLQPSDSLRRADRLANAEHDGFIGGLIADMLADARAGKAIGRQVSDPLESPVTLDGEHNRLRFRLAPGTGPAGTNSGTNSDTSKVDLIHFHCHRRGRDYYTVTPGLCAQATALLAALKAS